MSLKDYILASPAYVGGRHPVWGKFDAEWYRAEYGHRLRDEAVPDLEGHTLEAHWLEKGASQGWSPNCLFNEEWYRRSNSDTREGISAGVFDCGFLHYCESAFRSRSPHWLFSEENYPFYNPDLSLPLILSKGFSNAYDHFLAVGQYEQRQCHRFFDTEVFRNTMFQKGIPYNYEAGDFLQFLKSVEAGQCRTSWYFDPDWYLASYPQVAQAIKDGLFTNALHHYLTNPDPTAFNPNTWFSESHYAASHPDVTGIVENGGFRNGYDHFIRFGVKEFRSPHPDVDLREFSRQTGIQKQLRQGRGENVFTLWVQSRLRDIVHPVPTDATAEQYHALDLNRASTLLPALVRSPLDFRLVQPPHVSVILSTSNQFLETLSSLSALHAQAVGTIEIILVDAGSTDETTQIERFVKGVQVIRPQSHLESNRQLGLAVKAAKADIILLMEPGTQPFPGALRAALDAFSAPDIWGVGGQSLGVDGHVLEAGTIIWRDAATHRFGEGLRANADDISFSRNVDAFTTGMVFFRRSHLVDCEDIHQSVSASENPILSLCLEVRQKGGILRYVPTVLSRVRTPSLLSDDLVQRNRNRLRRHFKTFLSRQPLAGASLFKARFAAPQAKAVLFICATLPQQSQGGSALTDLDRITQLNQSGYHVTVFPIDGYVVDELTRALEYPDTVEIISDTDITGFSDFLKGRADAFDVIWVSGVKTLYHTSAILRLHASTLPQLGLVLDIQGTDAEETYLRKRVGCVDEHPQMLDALGLELLDSWMYQAIIAANDMEADNIRRLGYGNVRTLAPTILSRPIVSPGFHDRSGIVFALPIRAEGDAVHDGLHWFVQDVLPLLKKHLPGDARITLAGLCEENIDLVRYTRHPKIEPLGKPSNLSTLYRTCRIMIDPCRVLPYASPEIFHAACAGLPAVLTETTRNYLGWTDDLCANGGYCDPQRFADAVIRLYTDEKAWKSVSNALQAHRTGLYDPASQKAQLDDILALATGRESLSPTSSSYHPEDRSSPIMAPAPIRLQPRKAAADQLQPSPSPDAEEASDTPVLSPRLGISLPSTDA